MRLTNQDIHDIQNYVVDMASNQPIYNSAYDILTNAGHFNGTRWDKVLNAIEIATDYFIEAERNTETKAYESAVYYVTYFASVKALVEEVSFTNNLNDADYNELKVENEKRLVFEEMLLDFNSNRAPSFNRGIGQPVQRTGLTPQVNRNTRSNEMQNPMGNVAGKVPSLQARVPKTQGATSSSFGSFESAPAPSTRTATAKTTQQRTAKKEQVTEVKPKEYTAVSSDVFDLDKYPDHFPMAYKPQRKQNEQTDKLDEHLDKLLSDAYKEGERTRSRNPLQITEKSSEPVLTCVPASVSIQHVLRSVRDLSTIAKDIADEPVSIKASIYKPVITGTHDKIINFLTQSPLSKIAECDNIWELVNYIKKLRENDEVENVIINGIYSKLAQVVFGKLINNAIPETITSSDVIEDWPEIYDTVLDYVYDDLMRDRHVTTSSTGIKENAKATLDGYIDSEFETLRDYISCIVTESGIDEETVAKIKPLWDLPEDSDSLWQLHAVTILDIPLPCEELGIYVNNRELFKVTKDEANTLFKIIGSHVERTEADEDFYSDFIYITFQEREVYRIERVNTHNDEYHFMLTRTADIL